MRENYEWHDKVPEHDGDFFYTGPLPDGTEVVAVVQVFTHPTEGRGACVIIPPGWCGDKTRRLATVHISKIEEWKGRWSGPEHGICCAYYPSEPLTPGRSVDFPASRWTNN